MHNKRALITGVGGQDGAYLAEFLLSKGYDVHGMKRSTSLANTDRIDHLYTEYCEKNHRLHLHHGDLTDASGLIRIIQEVQPDEIYNLAAQSHVGVSFELPEYTANSDALGVLRILEGMRILGLQNKTRFDIHHMLEFHLEQTGYKKNNSISKHDLHYTLLFLSTNKIIV